MSKDLTQQHEEPESDEVSLSSTTSGAKNYITPQGYAHIRSKLLELIDKERPKVVEAVHWAASNGDRSENGDYIYGKKRLREIDRLIWFFSKRLEIAEIIDPSVHFGRNQVFFGATVTYADASGLEKILTILGIDEADSSIAQVSWVSPIARKLFGARVGDVLSMTTPVGATEIEVLKIDYPKPNQSNQ